MENVASEKSTWVASNFSNLERSLNGGAKSDFHCIRKQAFARFLELGFPSTKNEDWKYTNIAALARKNFVINVGVPAASLSMDKLATLVPASLGGPRIVFFDGHFVAEFSDKADLDGQVAFSSLSTFLRSTNVSSSISALGKLHLAQHANFIEHPFVALNTAFVQDGAVISIADGVNLTRPIQLIFVSSSENPTASFPRVLLVVGQNSRASVIETFISLGDLEHFTCHVSELVLKEGAYLDHYKLNLENRAAFHISSIHAKIERNAHLKTNVLNIGGNLVRNEVWPVLAGENCQCGLNGLSVLDGAQHVDNNTVIDHVKPNCESRELYKGIYSGNAEGVFSGTIIVREQAQKTNALQRNNSLLLSDTASVNSKPQLKIWADDVKCTHGATVGQLDQHALFYLRSRGIDILTAKRMLIHAFASDVLRSVEPPALRECLEAKLAEKLLN